MANIQNQKTASGGSVAGSLNAPLPGSRGGVASLATMRACLKPRRLSSKSRQADACSPIWLSPLREAPGLNTL
jgi:hypothetical protein